MFCQSKPIAFLPFSLPLSLFFLGTVAFGKLSLQHLACKMILGIVTLKNKSKRKRVGQGMFLDIGDSESLINCLFSTPFALYMLVNHRENSVLDQEFISCTYRIYLLNTGFFVKISMGYFLIVDKT